MLNPLLVLTAKNAWCQYATGLDSQTLLPKNQRDDLKLICKIKARKGTEIKRISTKILKMD